MYHSLDESGSPVSLAPEMFRAHMRILAARGIPVVPLAEAATRPGAAAITFDDGFHNFATSALPELARHRFPATVFAVTGHCGGRNDWAGQPPGIPVLPLMAWSELREAADAGIEIGAHTVTHPRLGSLDDATARREINQSADEIEQRLGRAVSAFAYPYGSTSPAARDAAGARFRTAVSTDLDYATGASDPLWLPRIDAYYFQSEPLFQRLLTPAGTAYLRARRGLRWLRRVARAGA